MKEESIVKEALEKYPAFKGFTSKGLSHDIYTGQKYKREGYVVGRSKGIESEKAKDERIKELEDFLQEVTSFNANHHPDYIINKAKQLLNK